MKILVRKKKKKIKLKLLKNKLIFLVFISELFI